VRKKVNSAPWKIKQRGKFGARKYSAKFSFCQNGNDIGIVNKMK